MLKRLILFFLFSLYYQSYSQQLVRGVVMEKTATGEKPIPGSVVYWPEAQSGVLTDSTGTFSIDISKPLPVTLTITCLGYQKDTVVVSSASPLKIILKKSIELREVEVGAKKESIAISTIDPMNVEKITQTELLRAACCNISEAFETNPSVNVDYKDAVTGIKEIQLLGLGGIYVQMLSENSPEMRGLAGIYGLTYIPGPWIESIQLTKGSGSVLNGYESTTGQINVEYKKPANEETPRFFLNLFGEGSGAVESNIHLKKTVNSKWATMLFLHGRYMNKESDRNGDLFMDVPNNKNLNVYNRWKYHSNKKLEGQIDLKYLKDDVSGGQIGDVPSASRYKTTVKTNRFEIGGKLGIVFPESPAKSFGNIFQLTHHDMKSDFGKKNYNAKESSFYYQGIYQNILWSNNQEFKLGVSFRHNQLEQNYPGLLEKEVENIPGVFLEYTYKYFDKITVVAGLREDFQDNKEWVFTPRLHAKYNFTEDLIFRISGGRSYRKPYLIADNLSVLASARSLVFGENIDPERAWNYGANLTKRGFIGEREYSIGFDAYRTEFIDQLIVDTYSDTATISFYNLDGSSYSNSFQVTFNTEVVTGLNFRLGYKLEDVKSTFNGKLEEVPLRSKHRILGTASYSFNNEHWKFDFTAVHEGRKKLQNVFTVNENRNENYSPAFTLMNFQVTKVFKKFELYAGSENLADYTQKNPIIHPENPFGNSFDATNIWGPIEGRRLYIGMRLNIW